jgi:hypothetical protein
MAKRLGYASYRFSPLKRITAEAKRIKKASPEKTWKAAVKEASKRYRSGKIGVVKGSRERVKKKPVAAVVMRDVRAVKMGGVKRGKRSVAPVRRAGTRRRVGAVKKRFPFIPLLLGAGAAFLLFKAFQNRQPQLPPGVPPVLQTGNPYRDDKALQIIAYAQAAGLAVDAISKLIQNLNKKADHEVANIYDEINTGGGLPPSLFV